MEEGNIFDTSDTSDVPFYQTVHGKQSFTERVKEIVKEGVKILGRPLTTEEVAVAYARRFKGTSREVSAVARTLSHLTKTGFIQSTKDISDGRRVVYALNKDSEKKMGSVTKKTRPPKLEE